MINFRIKVVLKKYKFLNWMIEDNLDKITKGIRNMNNFNNFKLVQKTKEKNNSSKSFQAVHQVDY